MSLVTVIIPNYNGMRFLAPCLDALRAQTMKDFDIIVVDDASSDGSVPFIRQNYPEVRVIEKEENSGFCRTANIGVRAAFTGYVILLNNDTVPEPAFVEGLYRAVAADERIFSCASCMLRADDPTLLDGAGDLYSVLGWAFARGQGKPAERYAKPAKVFSACGGAAIYRRDLFLELGLLDEAHGSYLEDLDLGYRAQLHGYRNLYTPEARVVHVGSGTFGARHTPFKVTVSARNNIYLIWKNMPLPQFIFNAPFLFAGCLVKYLYFRKKGFGKEYLAGIAAGFVLNRLQKNKNAKQKYLFKRSLIYFKIQLELWKNLFLRTN